MEIFTINAGFFKLDGGAMFGVVPKKLWNKPELADTNNLCRWAMRCLLVAVNNRLILIDTGMGDKQDAKFQSYYEPEKIDLVAAIRAKGFSENQITDVVLSHLHFDHAGGAVCRNNDRTKFHMTFPNAKYWTHSTHWESAINPNLREKATFLKENLNPISESGQLHFIDKDSFGIPLFNFNLFSGHTDAMIVPEITFNDKKIIFAADLIPSIHHINPTWVMAYDTQPILSISEKLKMLNYIAENNAIIVFDHDANNEACMIEKTERGFAPIWKGNLAEVI